MRNYTLGLCALLVGSVLLSAGCENNTREEELIRVDAAPHADAVNQAKRDWGWVSGTTWIASSIEGRRPLEQTSLWIRFEGPTWMSGSAGCNHLSASYERRGIDGLKVSQIAATRMHCAQPEGTMQQESRFIHLLTNADSYHAEADTLSLYTNGVEMLRFVRGVEAE